MHHAKNSQLVRTHLLNSGSSRYQVESLLGQGYFGTVVKCKNLDDKSIVAIKMIKLRVDNRKRVNQEVRNKTVCLLWFKL